MGSINHPPPERTAKFWRHVFGGGQGLLHLFTGTRDGARLADVRESNFNYPKAADAAAKWALEKSGEGREVYFCAHLLTKPRRVKENAGEVRTLWGDLDGVPVPNGELKPTAVVESSPGRYHAYWRLTDGIPPEAAERLNARLARAIGADSSGFDLTQLLRVPGTPNHKYEGRPLVEVLEVEGGRSYSSAELEKILPAEESRAEYVPSESGDEPPVVLSREALKVYRGEAPKLKENGEIDRSRSLVKIGRVLFDAGATRRGVIDALKDRDVALGWHCYTGRPDADQRYAGIVDELESNGRNSRLRPIFGGARNDSNDSNDSDSRELRELPDPERFPVDVFPRSVARLVREAAASMGCPADFLAVGALACMSAAIGDTRKISIKKGWTEGAALYAMIVGGAASKKSPALYEAVRPVLMRQLALKAEYDRQKEEYEIALARCDKDDEKPKRPVMGRTYVDDTTVEKLADLLKENPRGLALFKDELSGWLGSMDQYKQGGKGGDRQKWLQIHTNRPISVDRKSSEEPVIIPRPFVSIFGGIQPEVLPDFGKDRGDGLIDRFVAAYPEPMVGRWTDDEISDETREGYKALIDNLYRLEPAEHEGDEFASSVDMSDEGKAVFVREYNRLHEEIETPGFPQRLRPVYGKLEGYLARFALILAMARRAEARISGGAKMERVGREDMEGAAALLTYFKNHARRVYTGLYADSTVDNLAADLRSFLIDNGNKWEGTASELHSALGSEYKPARPEDLAKSVRAIAKRSPLLLFENLKRTKTSRGFRLTLENAVTAVTAVTPSPDEAPKGVAKEVW